MCLSHGMFKRKWLKKRDTTQPTTVPPGHFAGALYHGDAPRDFGPQIAYASWRWLPIPCPRQGSEGGKSRPLDHLRRIPFVLAPLLDEIQPYIYTLYVYIYIYIYIYNRTSCAVDRKWGFWDIDLGNFRKLGQDFLYLF